MSMGDVLETLITNLEPEPGGELSTVSDASFVGAETIRACTITTTVSDVRHGSYVDGIDGELREACVVILKFGFGRDAIDRIRRISIEVSFSALPTQNSVPGGDTEQINSPELRLYEPGSGQGKATSTKIRFETVAGAYCDNNPLASGGFNVRKTTEREEKTSATLQAVSEASNRVTWSLFENAHEKQGIPSELNCAVVLRTDQQSFVASVKFAARISSRLWTYTGERKSFIDSKHLRKRQGGLAPEETQLLEDMDSDEFRVWMKGKASNTWVAG